MGDGTKENPYTREDVLRWIEKNGGTAEKLELSNRQFVDEADLSDLELSGIILNNARLFHANFNGSILDRAVMQGANLQYATFNSLKSKAAILYGVDLRSARLQNAEFRGADLSAAHFEEEPERLLPAFLEDTDFRGAMLFLTNFKGCYFYGTKLERTCIRGANIYDAHLEDTDWGSYVIGEEEKGEFYFAEKDYRRLKIWHTNAGMYDIATKFYYREKEAARKGAKRRRDRAAGWLSWAFFGHGEGWKRILFWIAGFMLLFALTYFAIGAIWDWSAFWNSLYFSAVSFTALGYGEWVQMNNNWIKGIGAFESFIGVFSMALLLVTFVRKWTR